jgi:hypothetical protein
MTGPASTPVDVMAILADLQQQVSDLSGVVQAQPSTLADLTVIVRSQHDAQRQLLPDSALPPAVPSTTPSPAPSEVSAVAAVPAADGRAGGV